MPPSNPEKVVHALRENRSWLCDDCIARLAGITNRMAVNPITGALGLTRDFVKERGECSCCHDRKLVTRTLGA